MVGKIWYITLNTPLKRLYLSATKNGLISINFNLLTESEFIEQIEYKFQQRPVKDKIPFQDCILQLEEYFSGKRKQFQLLLDINYGTKFQQKVWNFLLKIPYGSTCSYQWVAKQIGQAKAVRAVGQANSKNPIPIIIPCHRVISTDGSLGGYSAGIRNKEILLNLERLSFI